MQLTAIIADNAWRTALQTAGTATIESAFKRALNLRLDSGELLSIFPKGSPNMPGGLVASHDVSQILGQAGEHIQITQDTLSFNGTTIAIADCHFVTNKLSNRRVDAPSIERIDRLGLLVESQAQPGSFYGAIVDNVFSVAQVSRLQNARARFLQAMRRQSPSDIEQAATQLVGLGAGLTPSGDDYLLGCLLVLSRSVMANGSSLVSLKRGIIDNLASTTSVSRSYLQAALDQRYSQPLRTLLSEADSDTGHLEAALDDVMAHGATSGQDICTGMIDAWKLLKNNH